jgi:predicted site-specific integrase-resolvase
MVLPEFNPSMKFLSCINNSLTTLPELNRSLQYLNCTDNPLPTIIVHNGFIYNEKKRDLHNATRILNRVRFNTACWKYKRQFRFWLWEKVRLPKAQSKYNPENLIALLQNIQENDEEMFHDVLESW